jgi:uncharacterized protein YegL
MVIIKNGGIIMLKEFVKQEARPLPVLLLLDVSGSMSGSKLDSLNQAVEEMIRDFGKEESTKAEIHLGIITFGGDAKLHTDLMPAKNINWKNMVATGMTPLGGALDIAKEIIEDKEKITSRAYRPSVILVSDGAPNDNGWENKMNSFINDGRSSKCDRWSLAIGEDADEGMLKKFINDPEKKLFKGEEAGDISKFFKFITMSMTVRTKSANPNIVPEEIKNIDPFEDEELEC